MKRSHLFVSALLATLLLAVPAQSQAFFGFFGGGFSFGFGGGWSGWGGPGWWGPGYWGGPGWWGGPGYWGGPGWWGGGYRWHHPYAWHHYSLWGYPAYGLGLPYLYTPSAVITAPAAKAPETAKEK